MKIPTITLSKLFDVRTYDITMSSVIFAIFTKKKTVILANW